MKIIKKIFLIILSIIGILIIIFLGLLSYDYYQESKFYNVHIPDNLNFDKPVEYFSKKQLDSIKSIKVNKEKIIVTGYGYGGYNFYMWHKPTEKGEIYIKAFELTQNVQLSEWKLSNRTRNLISELSNEYKLYEGNTVIDEGTFEKYYPTRFELWFKSQQTGFERKLTDKSYVIDGWDR